MKKYLQTLLCSVVVLLAVMLPTALASGNTVFRLHSSAAAIESISLQPESILLTGVPDRDEYDCLKLRLKDAQQETVCNKNVSMSGEGQAVFADIHVPAGRYSIQIFVSADGELYTGILPENMQIDWDGWCGTFYRTKLRITTRRSLPRSGAIRSRWRTICSRPTASSRTTRKYGRWPLR